MNDLSRKLVNTDVSHHTDDNKTWINIILVKNCDNIISFDCFLTIFSSRHHIISINTRMSHDLNSHLRNHDLTVLRKLIIVFLKALLLRNYQQLFRTLLNYLMPHSQGVFFL